MSNSYIDGLVEELRQQGIEHPNAVNKIVAGNKDDEELKILADMERMTGKVYSEEQKAILLHHGSACILACAGSGKALVNGTKVMTVEGYKPIEKLQLLEKIFDEYGMIQYVLGVFPQGKKKVYRIHFSNNMTVECCIDHLWTVNTGICWEVVDTKKIIEYLNRKAHIKVTSVNYKNQGLEHFFKYSSLGYLTTISKELPSIHDILVEIWKEDDKNISCTVSSEWENKPLHEFMGYITDKIRSTDKITIKSKHLCEVLEKILNYCGYYITYMERDGVIEFYNHNIRKNVYIIGVEETDRYEEMTCIKVSGASESFLLENGLATHNTTINTHLIAKRLKTGEIKDPNKMIYTTYTKASSIEMKERLDLLLSQLGMSYLTSSIQVRTIHSFFLQILRTFGIGSEIIDGKERIALVKQACREAKFNVQGEDLNSIANLLSYQVNNLLTDKKVYDSYVNNLGDKISLDQYKEIRSTYAKLKTNKEKKGVKGVIDYDDMQTLLYQWLVLWAKSDKPQERQVANQARDYCKSMWHYFYIDEAQDVSKLQFEILKVMVTDSETKSKLDRELVFIGDDDQCLLGDTQVRLDNNGATNTIAKIERNNIVASAVGNKGTEESEVYYSAKKSISEEVVKIVTKTGKTITGTYNHIGFAKLDTLPKYGVYLCLDSNKYFRISTVIESGTEKAWLLDIVENDIEAVRKSEFYSKAYNIPLKWEMLKASNYDSGMDILYDLGYLYEYPHIFEKKHETIQVVLAESGLSSKYVFNSSNKYVLSNSRLLVTDKNGNSENEICNSIESCCKKAESIREDNPTYDIKYSMKLTDIEYDFMNFGNMKEGMKIPVYCNGEIIDDEIVSVSSEKYSGYVYDLGVRDTYNFIANDIVVHNCIYQWRGGDPTIILNLGPTYNIKTFVLSTNYRCYSEIVEYSAPGIKCNNSRYDKSMNPFMKGGEVKIAMSKKEDLCNLSIMAMNKIKEWIASGVSPKDIAVLSRNNFHLAILSNMMLREGIYSDIQNDMKLTTSLMYIDIKDIIAISDENYKSDITSRILWKLCRYMSRSAATEIANFQKNCNASFSDTIGWVVKSYIDTHIAFDKDMHETLQIREKMRYVIGRLGADTREDLLNLYYSLSCEDREKCINMLLRLYELATEFLYKAKDKKRSISGLMLYVRNLIRKDGINNMIDFFRVTEQLESGNMAITDQKVTLSTIHSAKGKEWKNVIMFACDNISEPDFFAIQSMTKQENVSPHDIFSYIDEERRLFYVGNTRAKERLFVITYEQPSIFLLETLGFFSNRRIGNNDTVLELATTGEWKEEYDQFLQETVLNPISKYYSEASTVAIKKQAQEESQEHKEQKEQAQNNEENKA